MIKKRFTGLMFGEGRRDKDFIYALTELKKFKYHTKNWHFNHGNAHGCSASNVIRACKNEKTGVENIVLCFIDLDDLKSDFSLTWEEEKRKLEENASAEGIKIIWFLDKSEDEYRRVLGDGLGDNQVNREARKNPQKFINSDLWDSTLNPIREYENTFKEIETN